MARSGESFSPSAVAVLNAAGDSSVSSVAV
jgi:hypothetical protein